jgi:AcrR family transcriptional regulator
MGKVTSQTNIGREHGKDSREVILAVALQLFITKGYDGTSIDDIRAAAGFKSKASLYTHFKSKEEVADALMSRILAQIERACQNAYEAAEPEPLSRFVATIRALINWAIAHPQECVFHLIRGQQEKMLTGDYDFEGNEPSQSYLDFLSLVREMRTNYPVRKITDAALLSMVFVLAAQAVIDRATFGNVTFAEQEQQVLEMCMGIVFSEPVSFPQK